ncbi:unnamed protein product [Linum trigynum]|uniref:Uncharacterized protein n=1 Tax=Linum trigynum TaxID=586398 RepID=A0AAV2F7H0_9ROSI
MSTTLVRPKKGVGGRFGGQLAQQTLPDMAPFREIQLPIVAAQNLPAALIALKVVGAALALPAHMKNSDLYVDLAHAQFQAMEASFRAQKEGADIMA